MFLGSKRFFKMSPKRVVMTPSPSTAPPLDPEPASMGRVLPPRASYRTRWAFAGNLCLTWNIPACLVVVITCNSAGCCRALDAKGNALGSIFPPVQTADFCTGLHPDVTSLLHPKGAT